MVRFCRQHAAPVLPGDMARRGSQEESRFPHQQPQSDGWGVGLSRSSCGKPADCRGKPLTPGENSILQEGWWFSRCTAAAAIRRRRTA